MAELKAIAHRVTQCDEVRASLGPLSGFLGIFGGGGAVCTGISSYSWDRREASAHRQ